jgi:hypothetical protein
MKKYTHVIFLFGDWELDPRKHLYKEVVQASGHWSDFLFVQQPVCLLGHMIWRFNRIVDLLMGQHRTREPRKGFVLFTPVILFHYNLWLRHKILAKIDSFLLLFQLRRLIQKRFSGYKIILWVYTPPLVKILNKLKYDFLIYDHQDNTDYDEEGNWRKTESHYNRELIKKSNLVICTGRPMYEKSISINRNSIYLRNGNNFRLLTEAAEIPLTRTELSELSGPFIGYLGGIRNWIDFELVDSLLSIFQDVYIVFIGNVYRNGRNGLKNLLKYKNFKWVPHKPEHIVSFYLRRFNVGVIPFTVNEFTKGVFPNKFFEYMAMEIPIVTTALPELKKYSDIIGYSTSHIEFLENCKRVLNGGFDDKIKSYKQIARDNTWEARAIKINEILEENFN